MKATSETLNAAIDSFGETAKRLRRERDELAAVLQTAPSVMEVDVKEGCGCDGCEWTRRAIRLLAKLDGGK